MVMPGDTTSTVLDRTRQEVPKVTEANLTPYGSGADGIVGELYLYSIARFADEIAPWGYLTRIRDVQLREFLPQEGTLLSAFSTVAARNAAFSWRFDGGDIKVQRAQDILQYANLGAGYRDFVTRFTFDFCGQDNGAFVEIMRESDKPWARTVGINVLDAGRCWRTGDPRNPVLYTALDGKRTLLRYDQVIVFGEMPSNIERLHGIQYSAMSRALRAAQLWRDVSQYHKERLGGRTPQQVHMVNNINTEQLDDAFKKAQAAADNLGLYRFMQPIIAQGMKPGEPISVATIDLASLPQGFEADTFWTQYIAQLALALLIDYQDLAPLPGGNLGTATQSEVLAEKTRGKGPGLFMKKLEDAFNFYGVFGDGVTFSFDEQDLTEDQQQATVDKTRAEARAAYVAAGILTPAVVRQQMVDAGELDPEYLQMFSEQDVTDEATGDDTQPVDAEAEVTVAVAPDAVPTQPAPTPSQVAAQDQNNPLANIRTLPANKAIKDPQHTAMDDTEEQARQDFTAGLAKARGAMVRALRKQVKAEAPVVAEVRAIVDEARTVSAQQVAAVVGELGNIKASLETAVLQSGAANAETTAEALKVQTKAFEALAEATVYAARPRKVRRTVVRNEVGIATGSVEEEID